MHSGRVWAESEGTGKGSRFTVELPVASAGEADCAPASLPEASTSNGDRPALLLVEDSADSRETLVEALELLGYDVRQASSAEEALSMLKRWRPDAILSGATPRYSSPRMATPVRAERWLADSWGFTERPCASSMPTATVLLSWLTAMP